MVFIEELIQDFKVAVKSLLTVTVGHCCFEYRGIIGLVSAYDQVTVSTSGRNCRLQQLQVRWSFLSFRLTGYFNRATVDDNMAALKSSAEIAEPSKRVKWRIKRETFPSGSFASVSAMKRVPRPFHSSSMTLLRHAS